MSLDGKELDRVDKLSISCETNRKNLLEKYFIDGESGPSVDKYNLRRT